MPDVLQELLSCDVVFRPGHQVSSCLGVSAVREFVSLPLAVCAVTAAESERSGAGAPPVLRRWRHHLPGKSAGGRDHDQRPVRGTDHEGSRVILLENAQDVGDLFAVTRAGPAPADHDPLADIGGCEADLEPVAHAGHLFPGWAARAGTGPTAQIGQSVAPASRFTAASAAARPPRLPPSTHPPT